MKEMGECDFDSWLEKTLRPAREEKQRLLAAEIEEGDYVVLNASNSSVNERWETILTFSGIEATRRVLPPQRK